MPIPPLSYEGLKKLNKNELRLALQGRPVTELLLLAQEAANDLLHTVQSIPLALYDGMEAHLESHLPSRDAAAQTLARMRLGA